MKPKGQKRLDVLERDIEILVQRLAGDRLDQIVEDHGTSVSNISRITHREAWQWRRLADQAHVELAEVVSAVLD